MKRLTVALLVASGVMSLPARGQCIEHVLASPEPGGEGWYGATVIRQGDRLVVGDGLHDGRGAVFLYDHDGADWVLSETIFEPSTSADARFGAAIAISGDLLAIGAPNDNFDDEKLGETHRGSVFIYRLGAEGASLEAYLPVDPNLGPWGNYGAALAAAPDLVVIGWPGYDLSRGRVEVRVLRDGDWVIDSVIDTPRTPIGQGFGRALALEGDHLIIGAPGEVRVHAYRRFGGVWVHQRIFGDIGANLSSYLGLSGNTAVMGSFESNPNRVFVSEYSRETWSEPVAIYAESSVGSFPWFGWSVAIDEAESTIVVGATRDQELGWSAGAAHVFRKLDGAWMETMKLLAPAGSPSVEFGLHVGIDGDSIQVGSIGRAFLFAGAQPDDCNGNGTPDGCDLLEGSSCDANDDGVPDECDPLRADLDDDGDVGVSDLLALLAAWGVCPTSCVADLDCSGAVGFDDLLTLLGNWGAGGS